MLRTVLEARGLVAMLAAAGVGTWGLHTYPMRADDVFLALIELRNPPVFRLLAYGYATLWFTTPFFLASLLTSAVAIVVYRRAPSARLRRLFRSLRRAGAVVRKWARTNHGTGVAKRDPGFTLDRQVVS